MATGQLSSKSGTNKPNLTVFSHSASQGRDEVTHRSWQTDCCAALCAAFGYVNGI
jgi:hypothetical protein